MLVIIGTGLAGYMLAKEWRKRDQQTPLTLITQGQGDFYSKPLLSTALKTKKTPSQLVVNSAAQMAEQLNASIMTEATVTALDRAAKTISVAGKSLAYEKLVFACGATPIRLPFLSEFTDEIPSVNQLEDYALFRQWLAGKKSIAILGSGLVGCEFANDLLSEQYALEIISLDDYPLAKLVPAPIGSAVQQAFTEQGVQWHLKTAVKSIAKLAQRYEIALDNGQKCLVDGVLSALGLLPNTALAVQSGLLVDKGIVVDSQLRTNDASVFALGDCAQVEGHVKQYVAPLLQCARVLAEVLHTGQGNVDYPVMPIAVKTSCCPVVVAKLSEKSVGQWRYEGQGQNLQALLFNEEQLQAFALCGDKVVNKQKLLGLFNHRKKQD